MMTALNKHLKIAKNKKPKKKKQGKLKENILNPMKFK